MNRGQATHRPPRRRDAAACVARTNPETATPDHDADPHSLGEDRAVTVEHTSVEQLIARIAAALAAELAQELEKSSPWMSTTEAAEYLRCKPDRLKVLASQGRIPVIKEGARNLYHRDKLDQWLVSGDAGIER